MTNANGEENTIIEALRGVGLSANGRLHSIGIAAHGRRLEAGQVSDKQLMRYAADLRALAELTAEAGVDLPPDFWDVQTPAMQAVGLDEYTLVNALAATPYQPYVAFLARCYGHLAIFKQQGQPTAVATCLNLLRESAAYIQSGNTRVMAMLRPRLTPEQQAIFLWQQVATGTNRQVPYIHRDAYTHSYWQRFNVIEMWRYHVEDKIGVDTVWGLSGFHADYIRDPANTNQIEHATISALSQSVLRLPLFLLNGLEDAQWLMRESSLESARADKAVNCAIARHFLPHFSLSDVEIACARLEQALSHPPD